MERAAAGGAAGNGTTYPTDAGSAGGNSVFGSITAIGGGGGGSYDNTSNGATGGGSGGGIGAGSSASATSGTAAQGNNGGTTAATSNDGAGGGGAGAVGGNGTSGTAGAGGAGVSNSISGSAHFYGGGGGGGARTPNGNSGGAGGSSIGGAGGAGSSTGGNGTTNTGSGGGGGGFNNTGTVSAAGGNGGTGIVVIKYLTTQTTTSNTLLVTQAGNVRIAGPISLHDTPLYFRDDGGIDANHGIQYDTTTNGPILYGYDAVGIGTIDANHVYNSRMIIKSSGNVGIGVTNPAGLLNVGESSPGPILNVGGVDGTTSYITARLSGKTSGYGSYLDFSDSVTYNYAFGTAPTSGDFTWISGRYPGVAGTERMRLTQGGNLGIGTTPSYALDVNGTIRAGTYALLCTGCLAGYYQDASNGAYRSLNVAGDTGYYFQSNSGGVTTMYVGLQGTYNGRVGIRTPSPANTLDLFNGANHLEFCLEAGCLTGYGGIAYTTIKATDADLYFDISSHYAGYVATDGFHNVSDRNLKENFVELNPQDVLAKINQLPITEWNFKDTDPSLKHIGPMAQDFAQVFGLGGDNKSITTIDPAGIAFVGIQALSDNFNVQQAQIASLSANLANLTPVAMTDTGDLNLVDQNATDTGFTVPNYFTLNDALGNPLQRVGEFSDAVIANLKVGGVDAQQITTQALNVATENVTIGGQSLHDYIASIVSNIINQQSLIGNQNVISPIASVDEIHTNFISPVGSDANIGLKLDSNKLSILNGNTASSSAVAVFDNQGNATFSGNLTANNLTIQQLNNSGDATISGTLHAGKILASDIVGLASSSATYVTNNVMNIYNSSPAAAGIFNSQFPISNASGSGSSNFGLIANSGTQQSNNSNNLTMGNYIDISSYSGTLTYVDNLSAANAAFSQNLMVFGQTSLSDTSIVGQLSVDGNMILANDSINVLGSDLNLQPLRQGGLSVMGGLFYIDTDGNVKVGGNADFAKNVTVHGTLATNIISPLPGSDLSLNTGNSNLKITNASNAAVLSVNPLGDLVASGAATFSKLNLGLIQPAFAISPTEVIATGSAGVVVLKANRTSVTVQNSLVTKNSLIYITPVGQTFGQNFFLQQQVPNDPLNNIPGSFTVGTGTALPADTNFNFLIIN